MPRSKQPSRGDDSRNQSVHSAREPGELDPARFLLGASVAALIAYAVWLKAEDGRKVRAERRYDPRFPQEIGM